MLISARNCLWNSLFSSFKRSLATRARSCTSSTDSPPLRITRFSTSSGTPLGDEGGSGGCMSELFGLRSSGGAREGGVDGVGGGGGCRRDVDVSSRISSSASPHTGSAGRDFRLAAILRLLGCGRRGASGRELLPSSPLPVAALCCAALTVRPKDERVDDTIASPSDLRLSAAVGALCEAGNVFSAMCTSSPHADMPPLTSSSSQASTRVPSPAVVRLLSVASSCCLADALELGGGGAVHPSTFPNVLCFSYSSMNSERTASALGKSAVRATHRVASVGCPIPSSDSSSDSSV